MPARTQLSQQVFTSCKLTFLKVSKKAFEKAVFIALAFSLTLAFTLVSAVSSHEAKATPTAAGELKVEIENLSPHVYTDQEQLQVQLAIQNNTGTPLDAVASIRIAEKTPISRQHLQEYVDEQNTSVDKLVKTEELEKIPLGKSLKILSIDKENLPFEDIQQWGPRRISVELTAQHNSQNNSESNSDNITASTATFVLINPSYDISSSKLSVVVPLSFTDSEVLNYFSNERALALSGAKNRLEELARLASINGVTLAVDPAVLDVQLYSKTGLQALVSKSATEQKEQDSSQSESYETQLQKAIAEKITSSATKEIIATPYANYDEVALYQTGIATDIKTPDFSQQWAQLLPNIKVIDSTALTSSASMTPELELPHGVNNIIVDDKFAQPKSSLSYTPSQLTTVEVADKAKVKVSIVDQQLTNTIVSRETSAFYKAQMLLAQTAILTRQRPNDSRQFLIQLPADYNSDTSIYNAVKTLMDSKWVQPVAYSQYTQAEPSTNYQLNFSKTSQAKLRNKVHWNKKATEKFTNFTQTITEENTLAQDYQKLSLYALRNWKNNTAAQQYQSDLNNLAEQVESSVKILPSKDINLINSKAFIPITLTNTLPFTVSGKVELYSSNTRLQSSKIQNVQIPKSGSTVTQVPVKAIANGDVKVKFNLLNNDDKVILSSADVNIHVRAGWEDTGMLIFGIILAIMLVFGLVRTFKKGKRKNAVESQTLNVENGKSTVTNSNESDINE